MIRILIFEDNTQLREGLNILFSETQSGRLDKIVGLIYGFLFIIGIWFLLLPYLVLRKESQEVLEDN